MRRRKKKVSSSDALLKGTDVFTQRELSYFVGKKLAEDFMVDRKSVV